MICPWNKQYSYGETFGNTCPILWHTLYPYFLGMYFNAEYAKNGVNVCCPAEFGVDTIVRMRPNDGSFDTEVPADWRDVIHAEVVKVNGHCDFHHRVSERILFPTYKKAAVPCPAGAYNLFPFLKIDIPDCINKRRLRCPDWKEEVYYAIE